MTTKNDTKTADSVIVTDETTVPRQTGETKVKVIREVDGKDVIIVTDEVESGSVLDKVKTLLKNRKVLATAAAVLTVAAIAVVRNKNSQTDVEDEPAAETPTS